MKYLYTIICLLPIFWVSAQEETIKEKETSLWHTSAATTIPAGRIEKGIFSPMRIGFKNNLELSTHPLWFVIFPNASLKKNWSLNPDKKWQFATEHGFTIPTIALNLLSREGVGGVFPATAKAPLILTLKNRLIASYNYSHGHTFSIKAGFEINAMGAFENGFPDLELLIFYPRMASYNKFFTGEIGAGFSGVFFNKLGYDAGLKLFLIPDHTLTWVFEWNPKLYYQFNNRFRIMAGALVTTGNVPHEKANVRAIPVLDFQYTFKKKKK
jgi:hypothetical protein